MRRTSLSRGNPAPTFHVHQFFLSVDSSPLFADQALLCRLFTPIRPHIDVVFTRAALLLLLRASVAMNSRRFIRSPSSVGVGAARFSTLIYPCDHQERWGFYD
jgi:hypothetical protein